MVPKRSKMVITFPGNDFPRRKSFNDLPATGRFGRSISTTSVAIELDQPLVADSEVMRDLRRRMGGRGAAAQPCTGDGRRPCPRRTVAALAFPARSSLTATGASPTASQRKIANRVASERLRNNAVAASKARGCAAVLIACHRHIAMIT